MTKITAILQARMTSTRLPGKSLYPLDGVPVVEHIINRLQTVTEIDHIVLAIPDSPSQIKLIETAHRLNIEIFKGPEEDVLKRFLMAADMTNTKQIVRACGDNPLIDRQLLRSLIRNHLKQDADYTITSSSIPLGTGTEVVRAEALRQIAKNTLEPKYREHVTTWFHDHPKTGVQLRIPAPAYLVNKPYRLTIDTQSDLTVMEKIFDNFDTTSSTTINLEQVIQFLDTHPDIAQLNSNVQQIDWRHP